MLGKWPTRELHSKPYFYFRFEIEVHYVPQASSDSKGQRETLSL